MKTRILLTSLLCAFSLGLIGVVAGQDSAAAPQDLLKREVGNWDVKIKMWMGPEATESKGTETNKMVGDFWLVSDFAGAMMGAPFTGHSVSGYDAKTGKYTGTWVDSTNPNPTNMVGSYDAATKTMTYDNTGLDAEGNEMKSQIVVVYHDDGTHTFTMFAPNVEGGGEMVKVMEMAYTKRK